MLPIHVIRAIRGKNPGFVVSILANLNVDAVDHVLEVTVPDPNKP
jgi:hypothetical protein